MRELSLPNLFFTTFQEISKAKRETFRDLRTTNVVGMAGYIYILCGQAQNIKQYRAHSGKLHTRQNIGFTIFIREKEYSINFQITSKSTGLAPKRLFGRSCFFCLNICGGCRVFFQACIC